jgi:predicted nuclease of predicted toxin-antitoxin system
MKLKLDENFGRRCIDILSNTGHDAATVADQQMSGAADEDVIQAAHAESRCLVTLDLDFANPLRFKPANYSGIAVIRLSGRASYSELVAAVRTFEIALETEAVTGKRWIVEIGRIRIYRPQDDS